MIGILQGDAGRLPFADDTFDLVFGSPPYMDARTYGIDAQRDCHEWIEWMLRVTAEAVRVSKGLVIWNCAGVTRDWCYWPGPEGLLYEWFKRGGFCWRPAYWYRVGIPGSGGDQWLRADIEYCLAFTKCPAAIPWADNTANGHPPKWAPGGAPSSRRKDGSRVNEEDPWGKRDRGNNFGGRRPDGSKKKGSKNRDQWGGSGKSGNGRYANGERKPRKTGVNKEVDEGDDASFFEEFTEPEVDPRVPKKTRRCTRGHRDGDTIVETMYEPPAIANPGTLIKGIIVGGNVLGSPIAHENEAPFPVDLPKWHIRACCPPKGRVLDPFSGSGTTIQAAVELDRDVVGLDLRFDQCELARRRVDGGIQPMLIDLGAKVVDESEFSGEVA